MDSSRAVFVCCNSNAAHDRVGGGIWRFLVHVPRPLCNRAVRNGVGAQEIVRFTPKSEGQKHCRCRGRPGSSCYRHPNDGRHNGAVEWVLLDMANTSINRDRLQRRGYLQR